MMIHLTCVCMTEFIILIGVSWHGKTDSSSHIDDCNYYREHATKLKSNTFQVAHRLQKNNYADRFMNSLRLNLLLGECTTTL